MKKITMILAAAFCITFMVLFIAAGKKTEEIVTLNSMAMSGMTLTEETMQGLNELGINLVHQENPYEGYREKLLADWSAGMTSYDIVAVSDEWIADFVTPGFLTPLDEYVENASQDYNVSDFFKTPISLVGRYPQETGKLYTIPYLTFSLELAYNTKMFKEAGIVDSNGVAKPPKTLDDFIEACKKLTDPGKEKYAFAPLYLKGETVTIQYEHWHRVFTGFGGVLDSEQRAQVNTPGSIEALEFMKKILDYSPPGALNYRDFEVIQALKNGHVAMIFIWGAFGGMLNDPNDNPMVDYIAFGLTPGSNITGNPMPMGAAWGWGVPKYAKDKDISWKAIEYLTSKEVLDRELKHLASTYGAGPTRKSTFETEQAKQAPWLIIQGKLLPHTGYRPHLPEWTQISAILSDEISATLNNRKDATTAMNDAQKKIEDLFK